jgi:MOSC domain-containing protein YiiM
MASDPFLQGSIVQVNVSLGGLPKRAIAAGSIAPLGLEGDAHAHSDFHGGPRKAILLIAAETVEALGARGYPVFFGALGENLTTRGLAIRDLRIGDRLKAGGAVLEITGPRVPCSQLNVYGESIKAELCDRRVKALDPASPRWGMSGFYASVIEPGPVRAGDIIAVVGKLA